MLKRALFAVSLLFLMGAEYVGPVQIERSRHLLGVEFKITVFQAEAPRESLARLIDQAFAMAQAVESNSSAGIEDSLLSRINRAKAGESFRLDEDTFLILRRALTIARYTDGAYDPTDGKLRKVWEDARRAGEPPAAETVESALRMVGYQYILLDEASRTLTVNREGISLDLREALRSYLVEKLSRFLKENGVRSGLVSGGGSLAYMGWSQDGKGWLTGIEHPRQIEDYAAIVELPGGQAIATSGDYENFFLFKNKRFTDRVNAKTGYPGSTSAAGVSVIARDAALAKMVSEAFFVLGPEDGFALVERLKAEGVDAICIEETGGPAKARLTLSASEGAQPLIKEVRL